MKRTVRVTSLRQALTRTIAFTSIGMIMVAALFSGVIAFIEAQERQDALLVSIAELVQSGQLVDSGQLGDDVGEETLVIRQFSSSPHNRQVEALSRLPPGVHTHKIADHFWRLSIQNHVASGSRFMVAQQTDIRNESAITGALYGFVPAAMLVMAMLVIVNIVVRRQFRRLDVLAEKLDTEVGSSPQDIDEVEAPDEVRPFLAAIVRLLARNAEVLRRQRRFIADAAHELRSPIAALVLQSDNMKKAVNEVDARQRHDRLGESIARLQRLVTQLLDLARLQDRTAHALVPVDWRDVIRDVVTDRIDAADAREIDLGVSEVASARVNDDAEGLSRLLGNAIDNALRHTPPGGRIDIRLTTENGVSYLTVDDSGPGIPEADLEGVFEPFNRGTLTSSEGSMTGTGLGLSICREIAARLGGEVSLSNRHSGGLRFLYSQPLATKVS
uniref:sensor histidine kinase n=1 Tax=Marinobacterium profundum TaxID=1714300 RepID=UPI00131572C9|nr:ATP-binding protein [Marinobacterium profundum]